MEYTTIVGIDLARIKFHFAVTDKSGKVVKKFAMSRDDFFDKVENLYQAGQTFAFEACAGCHYIGQQLLKKGYKVIVLKAKDVKAYAKSRQKNDINDAIAICKAALDLDLKRINIKTREQQEVSYLHKSRQNVIRQRIQKSNAIMTSLQEFGYIVKCHKSTFAKNCQEHVQSSYQEEYISEDVYQEMLADCEEIKQFLTREKEIDKKIIARNKNSEKAQLLQTIPGIGPINASILSNKAMEAYNDAKDFSASLGLVPKQSTTGGKIQLGSITKQGDRYARTMLIQAARSVVMRNSKANAPDHSLSRFVNRMLGKGKKFNVICVALANKLARVSYACVKKREQFVH